MCSYLLLKFYIASIINPPSNFNGTPILLYFLNVSEAADQILYT